MKAVPQVNTESEVLVGAWPERPEVERRDQQHLTAEVGREQAIAFVAGLTQALADHPGEGVWIKISNKQQGPS